MPDAVPTRIQGSKPCHLSKNKITVSRSYFAVKSFRLRKLDGYKKLNIVVHAYAYLRIRVRKIRGRYERTRLKHSVNKLNSLV